MTQPHDSTHDLVSELAECLDNITLTSSKPRKTTSPHKHKPKQNEQKEKLQNQAPSSAIASRTRSRVGHACNNWMYKDSSLECHVCMEETNETLECGHKVCSPCRRRIKNSADCLYMCPVCKFRL